MIYDPIGRYGGKKSEQYKRFSNDFSAHRMRQFLSIFMQAHRIVSSNDVQSVLEFGGGRDVTKALSRYMGIQHTSVDIGDIFYPDVNSGIMEYQFEGREYDMVCSFQCLEHNPIEDLDSLVPHMIQFTKKYFYLSVPYRGYWFSLNVSLRLPKISLKKNLVITPDWLSGRRIDTEKIRKRVKDHPEQYHLPHWWEVGMPGLKKRDFINKIEGYGVSCVDAQHNPIFPHHWFLMFEKD